MVISPASADANLPLQLLIIVVPTHKESWLHRVAPERLSRMLADESHGDTESRRAIDYVTSHNRYSDSIEDETEEEEASPDRAIEEGNRRLDSALPGHLVGNNQPSIENEWAR